MKIFFTILFLILLISESQAQIRVSLPVGYMGYPGSEVEIPIFVDDLTGKKVYSYDFRVTFSNAILNIIGTDVINTVSTGMMVIVNTTIPGEVKVAAASSVPLTGGGVLVKLKFKISNSAVHGSYSPLVMTSFKFNSGSPSIYTPSSVYFNVSTFPILWVTPQNGNGSNYAVVSAPAGTTKLFVSNIGAGSFSWTAQSLASWMTITSGSSGINNGTINISYATNTSPTTRIGNIVITATNASGSPKYFVVEQSGSTPVAPVLTAPPDNVDTISLTPTFSWNLSAGSTAYNLQASSSLIDWSNPEVNVTGINSTSYKLTTPLINSLRYYWRVSASNSSGTSEWSLARSFVTVPLKPNVAIPMFPTTGMFGITTSPVFSWGSSPTATKYQIQISTNQNEWSTVLKDTVTDKVTYSVDPSNPLQNSKSYFWRIRAGNSGGYSEWSQIESFKTILGKPVLTAPTDASQNVSLLPAFYWNPVSEATSYNLQISDTLGWVQPIHIRGISTTSYAVKDSLAGLKTYYWRVNAENMEGTGNWSNYRTFKTQKTIPKAATLLSPANNSTCISYTLVNFSWKKDSTADTYNYQISTDQVKWDSTTIVLERKNKTTNFDTVSTLKANKSYYWRVNSFNNLGTGPWSQIFKFTTSLAAPVAVYPSSNAIGIQVIPEISWLISEGATTYTLQISANLKDWTKLAIDQSNIATTSFPVSIPLSYNSKYYWRIKAVNNTCSSNWNKIDSFKTTIAPPVLLSPADNLQSIPITCSTKWKSVAGAVYYNLQVSTDPNFNELFLNRTRISDTNLAISGLKNFITYYWRVNATDDRVTSDWSEYWKFTTVEAPPDAPILSQPVNGSVGISISPTLKWNVLNSTTTTYRLQIALDPNFNSISYDKSNITGSNQPVTGLLNSTTYYWRVNATNTGGTGNWSTVWSFTTVGPPSVLTKIAGDNQISVVNRVLLNPLLVKITDVSGYPVSDVNLVFSFSKLPDSTTGQFISTSNAKTNEKGEASTLISIGSRAGIYEVSATAADLTGSPAVFTITAKPGNPSKLVLVSGNIQSAEVNSALVNPLIVKICDLNNNPIENINIKFAIKETPLNATGQNLSVIDTFSNKDGLSSTSLILGDYPGSYRVTATSLGISEIVTFTGTATLPAYTSTVKLNTTAATFPVYSKTSDYQMSDWRIIGLPGASNTMISNFVDGVQNEDWQIYWDNGTSKDYLIKFDGGPNFIDSVGRAFWLIKKGDWNVQSTIPTAPLNANQEVEINLHSGWNMITNPFTSPIAWKKIQEVNNIKVPLFAFKGAWDTSNTFVPFTGYMFDNSGNLKVLKIPYFLLFLNPSNKLLKNESNWEVNVKLSTKEISSGSVNFGVSKVQTSFRKPRNIFNVSSISLRKLGLIEPDEEYLTDIRPENDELKIWDINTVTKENSDNVLVFQGVQNIPSNLEIYLVNENNSQKFNLRKDSVYQFVSFKKSMNFKILLGDKLEVEQKMNSILSPKDFRLRSCYPNPFNPNTTIPVLMPFKNKVSLKVYDILGKEISNIFEGYLEEGEYLFEWNGKDFLGNNLPSGTYIYRLITESGKTLSNKMILMK